MLVVVTNQTSLACQSGYWLTVSVLMLWLIVKGCLACRKSCFDGLLFGFCFLLTFLESLGVRHCIVIGLCYVMLKLHKTAQ